MAFMEPCTGRSCTLDDLQGAKRKASEHSCWGKMISTNEKRAVDSFSIGSFAMARVKRLRAPQHPLAKSELEVEYFDKRFLQ